MIRNIFQMNFIKTTNNIYFYILTYGLSFIVVLINASITIMHIDPRRKLSTDIKSEFSKYFVYYRLENCFYQNGFTLNEWLSVCVWLKYVFFVTYFLIIILDAFFESSYKASFICWLNRPSLYWGFLLPVGVMTFTNFCIFFALLKKVVFNSQKVIKRF